MLAMSTVITFNPKGLPGTGRLPGGQVLTFDCLNGTEIFSLRETGADFEGFTTDGN
jgi:hypothetical protein